QRQSTPIADSDRNAQLCDSCSNQSIRLAAVTRLEKSPTSRSSWDFPFYLAMTFAFGIKCVWMGKVSLFRPPFGAIFTWLGGISIDRNSRHSVVEQAVQAFQCREEMVLGIAPEGTRKKADYWKAGFYHIAMGANVPVAFAFLDYGRKITGFGPTLMPTGDIQADMEIIRDFYKDITAKSPENYGVIRVKIKRMEKGERGT
ncbi:MAG: 1-acyl-sn-glycerol-3-phosphate acyltransferase, partial [Anaerolineae bacterium]